MTLVCDNGHDAAYYCELAAALVSAAMRDLDEIATRLAHATPLLAAHATHLLELLGGIERDLDDAIALVRRFIELGGVIAVDAVDIHRHARRQAARASCLRNKLVAHAGDVAAIGAELDRACSFAEGGERG